MTTKELNVDDLLNNHDVSLLFFPFSSSFLSRLDVLPRPTRIPRSPNMMMIGTITKKATTLVSPPSPSTIRSKL